MPLPATFQKFRDPEFFAHPTCTYVLSLLRFHIHAHVRPSAACPPTPGGLRLKPLLIAIKPAYARLQDAGVTNVDVVWSRAEDGGRQPHLREGYDLAVARAVADTRVLAELCLPFVRVGGLWWVRKLSHPNEPPILHAGACAIGHRQATAHTRNIRARAHRRAIARAMVEPANLATLGPGCCCFGFVCMCGGGPWTWAAWLWASSDVCAAGGSDAATHAGRLARHQGRDADSSCTCLKQLQIAARCKCPIQARRPTFSGPFRVARRVAPKGPNSSAEVESASTAINALGGQLLALELVQSFGPEGQRTAVVASKMASTPATYPRRAGTPNKDPL
eukprot:365940-Chlamydomonas_euryale.AAC.12